MAGLEKLIRWFTMEAVDPVGAVGDRHQPRRRGQQSGGGRPKPTVLPVVRESPTAHSHLTISLPNEPPYSALHSQPSAFTLIELLVVVAIIIVLAALLLPALRSARDKAYTAACANQLRQINFALVLYQDDFNSYYPPIFYDGTTTRTDPAMGFMKTYAAGGSSGGYDCWLWLLYPYHHKPQIYICPSAKYHAYGWTYGMAIGFSGYINPSGVWTGFLGGCSGPFRQGKETYTDKKILVMDGRAGIKGTSPVGTSCQPYAQCYGGFQDFQHNGAPNGGPNCLFVDGHVGWLSGFYLPAFQDAGQRWFEPCGVSLP